MVPLQMIDALAQEADLRAAGDDALAHRAAGDRADLGDSEDRADLGLAGDDLLVDRLEQAEHRGLDLLDELVDDLVGADLHALGLGHLPAAPVGPDVEADDRGVGRARELHVVLGDAAHPAVHQHQLDVVALELAQRLAAGLERALDVGLEHDVERGGLAALDLLEEVLEARAGRRGDRLVADEARALRFAPRPGSARAPGRRPTRISSPAKGGSEKPSTCTGVEGPADLTVLPAIVDAAP